MSYRQLRELPPRSRGGVRRCRGLVIMLIGVNHRLKVTKMYRALNGRLATD